MARAMQGELDFRRGRYGGQWRLSCIRFRM